MFRRVIRTSAVCRAATACAAPALSTPFARSFGEAPGSVKDKTPSFATAKDIGSNGLAFAEAYSEYKDQFSKETLSLLRETHDKFASRQDELVRRRLSKDFVPKFTEDGKAQLSKVTGDRRKFDTNLREDLHNRKLELTGPVADPAMVITALNSRSNGVLCYMGDAEDASTCSLANTLGALKCNYGIARRNLTASKKAADGSTKEYKLNKETATYFFRVPNLHLPLPTATVDGAPMSAFIFHAVMYAANNAKELLKNGTGPYLYVPKLEGKDEAKYVDDVLTFVEERVGLEKGTIKVTVLIEAWPTVVELPGVIEALMTHKRIVGINAARWDYLASLHKHFAHKMVFPPRGELTMSQPFMVAYCKWIVNVAHHYGIHAIGGMSAFIPAKDAEQNAKAMKAARADKDKEAEHGLDGAWIAHPGMADIRQAFESRISGANQINDTPAMDVPLKDLMPRFESPKITQKDVDFNVEISLEYLAAFMSGKGAVALHNCMEDAATMEISRYNLWNHVKFGVKLENGDKVTMDTIREATSRIAERIKSGKTQVPYAIKYVDDAARILLDAVESPNPSTFLTLPAMEVVQRHDVGKDSPLDLRRPE